MLELWLNAFLLTLLIEIPIYFSCIRGKVWERLLLSYAPTGLTHPPLWFLFPWGQYDYLFLYVSSELLVLLVEGSYLKLMKVDKPFKLAFTANIFSALVVFLP